MNFVLSTADALPFQALIFLQKALDKNHLPEERNLKEILASNGEFYLAYKDSILVGALYLEVFPTVINVMLLGGENLKEWRDDLVSFIKDLMRKRKIENLSVFGRTGWGKMIPDLKPVCMFYQYKEGVC